MQKKLLGMAVATALAAPAAVFAQSAVQVYGTAHVSFNSTKYGESSTGAQNPLGPYGGVSKMSVSSHASNFGIRSSETLGGGMTGWVQYEFNVKMERDNDVTGGNGTSRNTAIGLRGNFGNVYFGTWETPYSATFRMWDVGTIGGWGPSTSIMYRRENTASQKSANCGNLPTAPTVFITGGSIPTSICYQSDIGGGVASNAVGYALWRRYGSAVFYDSPMFSGFQFKIGYQPNEGKAVAGIPLGTTTVLSVAENPSAWSASLAWTGMGGKARAFVANNQNKDWTTIGQTDSGYIVGGGFNFGVVDIGAAYEMHTFKANPVTVGDAKTKQYGVGLAIPMGSGKIGASYAIAKDMDTGVAGSVDNGAKMYNIGYEWALSKRTAVGFGYAAIKNDDLASFTWTGMAPNQTGAGVNAFFGSDVSNIFVAFRHSF
jgi:predicted porin